MMYQTVSEYESYPKDKVFVNSEYSRDPVRELDDARPSSDRDGKFKNYSHS